MGSLKYCIKMALAQTEDGHHIGHLGRLLLLSICVGLDRATSGLEKHIWASKGQLMRFGVRWPL